MTFKNVLVCVDPLGGDPGELRSTTRSALAAASRLREVEGAHLTIVAVVPDFGETDLVQRVEQNLAKSVAPELGGEFDVKVLTGTPFIEIIRAVLRDGYDLVVVAARGHSLVYRGLVGSTATRLLRKCPCPVWVTPRRFVRGPKVVLSAAGFHGLTTEVLKHSARIVEVAGGDWHVIHCMEYPEEGGMRLADATAEDIADYHRRDREAAWTHLHELCDGYKSPEPKLWLAEGRPDEQIIQATQELGADMVVMGTVGRSGIPGLLIGNTAESVLKLVECSVLALKPEGFVSPVTLEG